jgi:hypothetical protein
MMEEDMMASNQEGSSTSFKSPPSSMEDEWSIFSESFGNISPFAPPSPKVPSMTTTSEPDHHEEQAQAEEEEEEEEEETYSRKMDIDPTPTADSLFLSESPNSNDCAMVSEEEVETEEESPRRHVRAATIDSPVVVTSPPPPPQLKKDCALVLLQETSSYNIETPIGGSHASVVTEFSSVADGQELEREQSAATKELPSQLSSSAVDFSKSVEEFEKTNKLPTLSNDIIDEEHHMQDITTTSETALLPPPLSVSSTSPCIMSLSLKALLFNVRVQSHLSQANNLIESA